MAMEETPVWKLLIRLSAPVMLALLIQSIYNIVDSYFVARYSAEGLAALSIIFPIQLLMTALATGTGAGINILISRMDGAGDTKSQKDIISTGFFSWNYGNTDFCSSRNTGYPDLLSDFIRTGIDQGIWHTICPDYFCTVSGDVCGGSRHKNAAGEK